MSDYTINEAKDIFVKTIERNQKKEIDKLKRYIEELEKELLMYVTRYQSLVAIDNMKFYKVYHFHNVYNDKKLLSASVKFNRIVDKETKGIDKKTLITLNLLY